MDSVKSRVSLRGTKQSSEVGYMPVEGCRASLAMTVEYIKRF